MPKGKCKLCLNPRELQKSHLLPAALYRMTLDPRDKNPNPVLTTRKVAVRTSKQLRDYVFCRECEQRFNDCGERCLISQVDNGRDFPLLNKLNVAMAFTSGPLLAAFSGTAVGVDTEKLAYFVLSVLWRASVHKWRILGQTTSVSLGPFEDPIRKYLLGESGFPCGVVAVVTVCTDFASKGSFFVPCLVSQNQFTTYSLLTRGIYFRVLMGSNLPAGIRELCCASSSRKPIFKASCEEKTLGAFAHLISTAKITQGLS